MALTVSSTYSNGTLSAAGVGSGLDVNSLVSQLVAAKKKPQQDQIDSQTSTAKMQLSALGQVSSALTALQSALSALTDGTAFTSHKVSTVDNTVMTATGSASAVNGSYSVKVTQLATAMKASSGAFTDASTKVGTGTLSISVGDNTMNLSIDDSTSSLASIRDKINKASDNPGVTATIVTGTDGAHLVLRSTKTGEDNGFTVSSSGGDGGLAALNYDPAATSGNGFTLVDKAQNALFTIDGMDGSSDSNTVSAIDGVTLNLLTTGTTTVNVTSDMSAATSAVNTFVNAYNSFATVYKNLTAYDKTSGSSGALLGDATLNSIKSTLTNILGTPANGTSLSQLGISFQLDGTIKVDSDKLTTALGSDGGAVKQLFTGDKGLGASLKTPLSNWIGTQGILVTRTTNLNKQLSDLTDRQTDLDNRMDALTQRYTTQFTALDTLLTKLNSTSSYLQQQFDAMNNSNKK